MPYKNFQQEYQKLNSKQREAVEAIEGPVMVIAGPGTGKTQIIAMRIANILLKTHTNPSNILCLTFTNSGVSAMKQRLLSIIGPPSYQVQVYTFHSFCSSVIDRFPEKFLFSNKINQLDDLEQIFFIQNILNKNDLKFIKPLKSPYYYQNAIIKTIGQLKQEGVTPKHFLNILKKDETTFDKSDLSKAKYDEDLKQLNKNKELAIVYNQYQKLLIKKGKYDYNDMILYVLKAFHEDKELLNFFQEKFQYILVDEYQDTNNAQNEIVNLLGNFHESPNLFVVGDDEQSIYRFQGASMENILTFKIKYRNSKIIILEDNYRSGQNILDATRKLILNNKNQISNRLKINKDLKNKIAKYRGRIFSATFSNDSVEYFFIAKEIKRLIKVDNIKAKDIAILYRNNRDAEELIDILSKFNIPYRLEIGRNVLDDPEINKIIQYFKVLNISEKIEDNLLLFEVMHYPFFRINTLDIYKITSGARIKKKNIFSIISSDLSSLNLENIKSIKLFVNHILECREICQNNNFSLAFQLIIEKTGFLEYLLSKKDSVEHLNRLQVFFKYIQLLNTKDKSLNLDNLLKHLELLIDNNLQIKEEEISPDIDAVNIMTAHKSKGLEFDVVFITHLTDKHWGNSRERTLLKLPIGLLIFRQFIDANNEEERRLFYVALTRAKKYIYLSYALKYNELINNDNIPSIFLSELPNKLVHVINPSKYEKDFRERLKLKFSDKKWVQSRAMKDFLKTLIADLKLSPTALNTYLSCPQRFLMDNILRIPKAKDFSQSYGTAIHFALERYFKRYLKDLTMPNKILLLDSFKEGLDREILNKNDFKRALGQGIKVLNEYHTTYLNEFKKNGAPIYLEYDFGYHDVHFKDVPITGRIDKIELMDSISNKVRIVDYKTTTAKSLNFLLGKTKEQNKDYLYQAYFYRLLTENDPLFKWKIGEVVFDFISDHGFKRVSLPIDENDFNNFKLLILDIYKNIKKMDFPKNIEVCENREIRCNYNNICK